MTKIKWTFFILGFAFILSSCGLCTRPSPSLPSGYSIPVDESDLSLSFLSRRVNIIADNHILNLYNEPVTILRSGLADHIKQSAIRPIQLDFYGQDFLKWLVENANPDPIVHLGDTCNFSCTGEFEKFVDIIQKAKESWVYVPGNHDGFFFGNEQRSIESGDWPDACRNAGEPMTKDRLVRLYLSALAIQDKPGIREFVASYGLEDLAKMGLFEAEKAILNKKLDLGNWRYNGEEHPFLHSISWKIDKKDQWKSFVVQELDLFRSESTEKTPVRAILLDTSQYENKPTLIPTPISYNSGITGEFLSDQIDVVKSWIESDEQKGPIYVIFGHYPFDALSKKSQEELNNLRKRTGALVYISAHTHAGQFIVHGKDNKEDKWLELNIGSLLDWNLEYRTLQISRSKKDNRLVIRSPRITMPDILAELEQLPINEDVWEAKPGENDYYLSHENIKDLDAQKTEVRLKNVLLAMYHRLISSIQSETGIEEQPWPSGSKCDEDVLKKIENMVQDPSLNNKIAFLLELDRFEQSRKVKDEEAHQQYRLSQAIWASKYDSMHARKPLEDDWFIVFPMKSGKKE